MTSAANYRSSWTKAESGSLDIHGQDLSNNNCLIWFRHQAYVEAMGLNAHINTSMRLSLSNPSTQKLNLDVVKSAIRQLRFDHPSIASKHGWSAQPPKPEHAIFAYEVPTSEIDMDDWLSTVVLDKTDVLKALNGDLQKAIDAITYELGKPVPADRPVFLLHYIPALAPDGQHALVFYFAHTIFDAIGTFQIMELCAIKIAEALEKGGRRDPLPWGEEVSRLPIALVESARVPRTTEKTPEDVAVIQQYKDLLDSLSNVPRLPVPHPESSPSATGLITKTASPEVVTSLRTAARTHGCTIYSLLMAAMSLASVRIWPIEDTKKLALPFFFSPIDIRPLGCVNPYDRSQWQVRVALGFNSYVVHDLGRFVQSLNEDELTDGVWTIAKEVKKQSENQNKFKERMPVLLDDILATITGGLMRVLGDEPGIPTHRYPTLSSFGVMDQYLSPSHPIGTSDNHLTVSSPRLSPWFCSVYGGCCIALHAFTWQGELIMAFTFPEGVMGTKEDQLKASKERRKEEGIVVEFIDEFMRVLEVVSKSTKERGE